VKNQQEQLFQALQGRRLVKVIAGIDNFDLERVAQVVRAATAAGAGAVDVAARADIVELARQLTDLPIFASSVTPEDLATAIASGADVAEIGNFDALYKDGFYLSADDVVKLTEQTRNLLPKGTPLSVTIPGHLSMESQVRLAQHLESMGVTMLQTEGASRVITLTKEVQLLPAEEKARLTLENTEVLAACVSIPVMTASGVTVDNVLDGFKVGAAAVGVGSTVNRLTTEADMVEVLTAMMQQVGAHTQKRPFVIAS
jgi:2-keto-3-deoxy-6-phosphogluconate aldolase